jgi:hypothetical protein
VAGLHVSFLGGCQAVQWSFLPEVCERPRGFASPASALGFSPFFNRFVLYPQYNNNMIIKKFKIKLLYDLALSLLGKYPKKIK